ncbi:MAG: hypothetical protein WA406_10815, partial [Pseudolabrys sp.]
PDNKSIAAAVIKKRNITARPLIITTLMIQSGHRADLSFTHAHRAIGRSRQRVDLDQFHKAYCQAVSTAFVSKTVP